MAKRNKPKSSKATKKQGKVFSHFNAAIHTYTGCPECSFNIQPQIDAAYSKGFAAALGEPGKQKPRRVK
jgi:hypothetical protein